MEFYFLFDLLLALFRLNFFSFRIFNKKIWVCISQNPHPFSSDTISFLFEEDDDGVGAGVLTSSCCFLTSSSLFMF